jgi:asparagine synthase (glutamine-hydrolysing)
LIRALGSELREELDDPGLLLAAYAKWGEDCPNFLLGEFAFAIWDERLKRLFCCRDHMGFRAFLYWQDAARFAFAGDIEPILACPDIPREVNRRKLAALAVPTAHFARHEETYHAGIFSLPPGTSMTVEKNRIRQTQYWEPKLGAGPTVPKRPEDAFDALRDIVFQAVECRLDRDYPVAALLSGGLDSSAIVAVAARCLEKQNRELTAIAAVLTAERRAQIADEREYIEEFRSWPNIRIQYVTAGDRGPFDSLHDLRRFSTSPLYSSRHYLDDECEKAAIAVGARTLLFGAGGELGLTSWSERYHLEMAVRFRWTTLFRELKKRRTSRKVSPIRILAGELLSALFPRRGWSPAVLLARDFQRERKDGPAFRNHSPYQRPYQAASLRLSQSQHADGRGQSIHMLPLPTPLRDKRILEFCLAMPTGMDVHNGYRRYPVRAALNGILPPRIQWRTDKLPYSPDYHIRYNAQLGIAREFVSAIAPRDPVRTVVDVDKLRQLLVPSDKPTAGSAAALGQVPATIYLICFLRQFSAFRA